MAAEANLEPPREGNSLEHRQRGDPKECGAASFEESYYYLLPAPATFSVMGHVVHLHQFERANPVFNSLF